MSEVVEEVKTEQVEQNTVSTEQKEVETTAPELSKEQVEAIQKKAYGYAMQHLDQALEEMGYKKPEGVKSTEYVKQILADGTKKGDESVNSTKGGDPDVKARLEALQNQLKEKETLIGQLKESTTTQKREFFLNQIVESAPITAPDHLGDQEKERYVGRVKSLIRDGLKSNYQLKEVEGDFRFYSKEGEPLFDGTPDLNPIKPNELLQKEFSEFFVKPKSQQKVAGTGGLQESGEKTSALVIPSNVKTKYDYYEHLVKDKGFIMGSKEFNEQLQKAQKERPSLFK
jgi:hypothetical protein